MKGVAFMVAVKKCSLLTVDGKIWGRLTVDG